MELTTPITLKIQAPLIGDFWVNDETNHERKHTMQTGTALLIEQAHDNHLAQLLAQIHKEQPVDPRLILVDTRILMAILRELGWLRLK